MKAFIRSICLASLLVVSVAPPASAHAGKQVGEYEIGIGWGEEPAYAGSKNAVQVTIHDHDEKPVTDLGDTLRVTVSFGDQTTEELTLEPRFRVGEFGTPGEYGADLIPTRPGRYTFHLKGTIDGQRVDITMASGEKTFDDVVDPAAVAFPVKDPTTGQLAERLDRGVARVTADARAASDDASLSRVLGMIGIALGLLALGVAASKRRAG